MRSHEERVTETKRRIAKIEQEKRLRQMSREDGQNEDSEDAHGAD